MFSSKRCRVFVSVSVVCLITGFGVGAANAGENNILPLCWDLFWGRGLSPVTKVAKDVKKDIALDEKDTVPDEDVQLALGVLPEVSKEGSKAKITWRRESSMPLEVNADARAQLTLEAAQSFKEYFAALNKIMLERDYALDAIAVALIAGEHVLLVGDAGNGKSQLTILTLGNIKEVFIGSDGSTREKPSFFKTQMTRETSLAQTHGSIDFSALAKGTWERLLKQGMLGQRGVFLDEFFDVNFQAMRNILEAINERTHSEAGKIHKGKLWTMVGATNLSIPELYLQAQGVSDPQAVIDRFLEIVWINKKFEFAGNLVNVIDGSFRSDIEIPRLTWNQIRLLRDLAANVEIPEHVGFLLAKIHDSFGDKIDAYEQSELDAYDIARRSGQAPLPPFKSNKFASIRSAYKAGKKLRAEIVLDWISSNGGRSLVASTEDLLSLRSFYAARSIPDEEAKLASQTTFNSKSKKQIDDLLEERKIFDEVAGGIIEKFNEELKIYPIDNLAGAIEVYASSSTEDKTRLLNSLKHIYKETRVPPLQTIKLRDLKPETIAKSSIHQSLRIWLDEILGATEADKTIRSWEAELPALPNSDVEKK